MRLELRRMKFEPEPELMLNRPPLNPPRLTIFAPALIA